MTIVTRSAAVCTVNQSINASPARGQPASPQRSWASQAAGPPRGARCGAPAAAPRAGTNT
eukprot:10926897-Lingulodinium_polyedra.AAC.1